MELDFCKYEGAGNDFILIDGRNRQGNLPGALIRMMCDRHRGIGADGLMILSPEEGYDFRMTYYNADGGEVNMCGNGARCISLFAHHLGIGGTHKRFAGRDGCHTATILSSEGFAGNVEIGMIDVDTYEFTGDGFFMNTGVPHYIRFVDDTDAIDVFSLGREIRYDERFRAGGGTNVNFVQVLDRGDIRMRTYERGVEGETLACGTGATAAAIATHLHSQPDCNSFTVRVEGGLLGVSFDPGDNQHFHNIRLSGPARRVYCGTISVDNLL